MAKRTVLSEQQKQDAVAAYVAGKTTYEVAEIFGVSAFTVQKYVNKAGAMRGEEFRAERNRKIVEAHKNGELPSKIAKSFGVDRGVVFKAVGRVIEHKPQKRLTNQQRQAVIDLYLDGDSTKTIGGKVGLSQSVAHDIVTAAGIVRRKEIISAERKQEIVAAYLTGKSTTEIAREFEVSTPTVTKACREAGVERRPYYKLSEGQCLEAVSAYQKGESSNTIAAKYGVSGTCIMKIIKAGSDRQKREKTLTNGQRQRIAEAYKQRGKSWRAENHYNWKGNDRGSRSELRYAIRGLVQYHEWRKAVFVRDHFTCQHCQAKSIGKSRRCLEADHKYPFSALLDNYKITTVQQAIDCSALWDVSNGQTLCRSCHEQTPTFGSKAVKYRGQ